MDHVLPMPDPDWDNPKPYDGPTDAETEAFRHLRAAADGIRVWVTGAYVVGTTPEAWREFSSRLEGLARMCAELGHDKARTVGGIEPEQDSAKD